jgi:uridine kinase
MDFDRLEREVLIPFADKQDIIRYGHFDAKTESISETIEIQNAGILIIEGVGLFRPELMKYFTFKIWMDCPIEEAIARGKKRDREEYGNPQDELWEGIWRENDMQYYETYKPKEAADVIIANSYSGKNGATGRDF